MNAPESHADIESALADAFAKRHAQQRPARPSLVDVRRRAHRQSSRRAGVRAGAVVGAGATVVAGGWAVTREESPPTAVPAAPVTTQVQPGTPINVATTTLSVDDLWAAVAAQLGTTVDDLRVLNPMLDFGAAPIPDTPIVVRRDDGEGPTITTPWPTVVATTSVGLVDTTTPPTTVWIDTTVTLRGSVAVPEDPLGWTTYEIVTGDYLVGIARQFCTTVDELVAANRWGDGNLPLYPGDLIAVPADAC